MMPRVATCLLVVWMGLSIPESASALDFILPQPVASEKQLIGTWNAQMGKTIHTVIFAQDHSFKGTRTFQGQVTETYSGTWCLNSGTDLIWTYAKLEPGKPEIIDQDRVMSMSADAMTLLNGKKQSRVWTRKNW